jgi:hypothetical protein
MFKLGKFKAAKHFAYQAQTLNKASVEAAHNCAGCELVTGHPDTCTLICMGILKHHPEYRAAAVLATIARAAMTGRPEGLVELRKSFSTVDQIVKSFLQPLELAGEKLLHNRLLQALEGSHKEKTVVA